MNFKSTSITRALIATCGALVFSVGVQAAGDKPAYEKAKQSAKATYESAKKQCDSLAGNTKDICQAEAKAARTKTEATAEAEYKNTPKARYDAKADAGEADYKVAKERCDDKGGNDKDVCVKEAKSVLAKVKADAKAERDTTKSNAEATQDKMKAEYKAAAEKCDAMKGDSKDACIKQAKVTYKM